jgi:hypothetical protein
LALVVVAAALLFAWSVYRSSIETVKAAAETVRAGVTVKFKVGEKKEGIFGAGLFAASATCDDGYVVVGGVCEGNPLVIVHPMTAFGPDKRTFSCNFDLGANTGTARDRWLRATASCVKGHFE